jgi:hypothetical protein
MFSEAHRKKTTKNDALAGNTQIEDSAVLQGLAVHTRTEKTSKRCLLLLAGGLRF